VGPAYPLTDEEKNKLAVLLQSVPADERFHIDVYWPQLNGTPHYAVDLSQVFLAAQWDETPITLLFSASHGLVFGFSQKDLNERSEINGFVSEGGHPLRTHTAGYSGRDLGARSRRSRLVADLI